VGIKLDQAECCLGLAREGKRLICLGGHDSGVSRAQIYVCQIDESNNVQWSRSHIDGEERNRSPRVKHAVDPIAYEREEMKLPQVGMKGVVRKYVGPYVLGFRSRVDSVDNEKGPIKLQILSEKVDDLVLEEVAA
jgi:hypothetical protein